MGNTGIKKQRADGFRLPHLLLLVGVLMGVGSVTRWAQANEGALAEELFRQGQALMQEERFDEACPKLAESQRLEPSTGTLLNLAVCHEKQGKLASAWNEFQAALAAARRDGREDRMRFAEEHIKAIEPNLSRLTITLPKESDVEGLEVQLDGTKVGSPALGVALPVDPGTHEITVSAPGKNPWKSSIEIPEGPGQQSVSIPVLSDASVESTAEANAAQPQDSGKKSGNTQRYVAYGTAGLGLVGLGLGAGFGLNALGKNSSSNKNGCDANDCNNEGANLRDAARKSGDVSTVAFIAGGVLLGSAVVLYFTAPRSDSTADTGAAGAGTARDITWTASLRPTFGGGTFDMGASW